MTDKKKLRLRLPHGRATVLGLAVFSAGAFSFGGFSSILGHTNETEFCTSCHSMKRNYEEYKETVHYKNASGVSAGCADCHVPKEFLPKLHAKVMAAKDVYHEVMGTIDTEEAFEARRWLMATRVWDKMKANDSRECRSCHSFDTMELSSQGRSARKKHSEAAAKGETCIDCHKGIAHEQPDAPLDEVEL